MGDWYGVLPGASKIQCPPKSFSALFPPLWNRVDWYKAFMASGAYRWASTKLGDNIAEFKFVGAVNHFLLHNFHLEERTDPMGQMRIVPSGNPSAIA